VLSKVERLQSMHLQLQSDLQEASNLTKRYYDRKVKEGPAYKIGDQVWLLRRNIVTQRPSSKLDHKKMGPFRIVAQLNPVAYKLDLPYQMKIHPVFHVSLLELFFANTFRGRTQPPPPEFIIDDIPEYEVQQILDSRIRYRKLQYRVDWKGYDVSHQQWEPAENVEGASELIAQFHAQYPSKPSPAALKRAPSPKNATPPQTTSPEAAVRRSLRIQRRMNA
jgi:hypothetical protein